jgi:hypothetical protein
MFDNFERMALLNAPPNLLLTTLVESPIKVEATVPTQIIERASVTPHEAHQVNVSSNLRTQVQRLIFGPSPSSAR